MCCVPGPGWAELPLSCLESNFLGVKLVNKPGNVSVEERGSRRYGGSCHFRVFEVWEGGQPISGTPFPLVMCLVLASCDPGVHGCRVIEVRRESSRSNRMALTHGQVCLGDKCGDILPGPLHSHPRAHPCPSPVERWPPAFLKPLEPSASVRIISRSVSRL